jgi:hydrogenase maturation protease
MDKKYKAVIMGVGNILWADEGFGNRAVEAFNKKWRTPENVQVIDGGTLGYFLQEFIEETDNILIFDCADVQCEPGTLKVIEGKDITPYLQTKVSAHQQGLNDLFAMAMVRGRYPKNIAIIGCQPKTMEDYGGSLTPEVSESIGPALDRAEEILKHWGIDFTLRCPNEEVAPLGEACLARDVYESERPSEGEAFREGDIRFINMAKDK